MRSYDCPHNQTFILKIIVHQYFQQDFFGPPANQPAPPAAANVLDPPPRIGQPIPAQPFSEVVEDDAGADDRNRNHGSPRAVDDEVFYDDRSYSDDGAEADFYELFRMETCDRETRIAYAAAPAFPPRHVVDDEDSYGDRDDIDDDDAADSIPEENFDQQRSTAYAAAPAFLPHTQHLQNHAHHIPVVIAAAHHADAVPPPNEAAHDAGAAAAGHGNIVDDGNALGNNNEEDEWEIDDWNEGMREGWDWVPLAVVCTILGITRILMSAECTRA